MSSFTGECAMDNRDTNAAWHCHSGTKHPDGFLMSRWHTFDPSRQPLLFKQYLGLDYAPLPLDKRVYYSAWLTRE